jgi:hypothetical protein
MKLVKALIAASLVLAFQQTALAVDSPANTLSAADIAQAFEQTGTPMQVSALSQEEMAQTQGAYSPYGASVYLYTSTYLPRTNSGASQIGMSILSTLNNKMYGSYYGSLITNTAYSRAGGYYRTDGR